MFWNPFSVFFSQLLSHLWRMFHRENCDFSHFFTNLSPIYFLKATFNDVFHDFLQIFAVGGGFWTPHGPFFRKAVGGGPPTVMSRAPAAGLPTPSGASWIPCHAVERGTWRTSSTCWVTKGCWEIHGLIMENHGKTIGKPWENGGLPGLVMTVTVCELENGDLVRGFTQLENGGSSHGYVSLPEGSPMGPSWGPIEI